MAMSQGSWYDKAFISICPQGASEVELRSKTTSLSLSGGNFDIEGIETFGGKIVRLGTKEDIEISFEGIPTSHADFDWLFAGQTASTAFGTGGVSISTSAVTPYRISMLWTNFSSATGASQAITGTSEAYRRVYANAYCTSLEPKMDAGNELTVKVGFKLTDQDSSGSQNWMVQAKDTTSGTLSALPAYTSVVKF
jgi:hypothetical protein